MEQASGGINALLRLISLLAEYWPIINQPFAVMPAFSFVLLFTITSLNKIMKSFEGSSIACIYPN